jgi:hypothetical protein
MELVDKFRNCIVVTADIVNKAVPDINVDALFDIVFPEFDVLIIFMVGVI